MTLWHVSEPQRLKPRGGRPCPHVGTYRRAINELNQLGRWRT